MRLLIDTSGVRFLVGRPAEPKRNKKGEHLMERDTNRPEWTVQLVALDSTGAETITVTVAGEQPKLTAEQPVRVEGLRARPWLPDDARRPVMVFRADSVVPAVAASGKSAA